MKKLHSMYSLNLNRLSRREIVICCDTCNYTQLIFKLVEKAVSMEEPKNSISRILTTFTESNLIHDSIFMICAIQYLLAPKLQNSTFI